MTGKFTDDGANSWRRADGTWSRSIAEAELLNDEATGKVYCLVEAPSPQAAEDVHREAHGLLADLIQEVTEGA